MMTVSQSIQFNKHRSLLISMGFNLSPDRKITRDDIEITTRGETWIVRGRDNKVQSRDKDLGRLLRARM